MMAACTEASMASLPRVGPIVDWSMTATSRGSAPPSIRIARFLASSAVKLPVIWVEPPGMPTPHWMSCTTSGEEMIRSSSAIAIRRGGVPICAQAAFAVRSRQALRPSEPLKSTVTYHPVPWAGSLPGADPATRLPPTATGPTSSFSPPSAGSTCWLSLGSGSFPAAPEATTGWKLSCAV